MKNNEDLVSVIIPTYNRALKCKEAVASVLLQTHGNVEVIVVDDESNDNTKEIIYGMDDRVKFISQRHAGVSAARNAGLEVATGDYIAFLDSDDAWLPWKLEAQLSVLRAFPEAVMVWTDMTAVDNSGTTLHESYLKQMYGGYQYFDRGKHFETSRSVSDVWSGCPDIYSTRKCYFGNIFSWMFMGNLVHTSTVLLRRECQKKVGLFDLRLINSGEDYDFHFRTCRVGKVAYLDVPSIRYRVGAADQLTEKKYMVWVARNNLITLNKMLSVAESEIHLPRHMIRQHLAWSYAWVGLMEFGENHVKIVRSNLVRSLRFSPFQVRVALYLLLSFLPAGTAEVLRKTRNRIRRIVGR